MTSFNTLADAIDTARQNDDLVHLPLEVAQALAARLAPSSVDGVDLEELRRLLEGAAPRPWTYAEWGSDDDRPASIGWEPRSGQRYAIAMQPRYDPAPFKTNAALIVAVVNALPAILAALDQHRQMVDELEGLRRAARRFLSADEAWSPETLRSMANFDQAGDEYETAKAGLRAALAGGGDERCRMS